MDPTDLSTPLAIAVSAAAGAISFLSPCVAPLVPGYLAFVAPDAPSPRNTLTRALAFVLGFSLVFMLLGATAATASRTLAGNRDVLELVGGLLVALIGLALLLGRSLGVTQHYAVGSSGARAGVETAAARITARLRRPAGALGAVAVGGAFAVAWSPCIGPALAAILALAGTSGDAGLGALLLLSYSLGLGVPFLLAAVMLDRVQRHSRALRSRTAVIRRVSGVMLLTMGVLIASGGFGIATARLARLTPGWLA